MPVRAGRLLSVLLILQTEGRVTAGQLARRLEVSERTVLRDLAELGSSGVPVYAVRGPRGGFELLDTYRGRAPAVPGPARAPAGVEGRLRRVRVLVSPAALQRAIVAGEPEGWRPRPYPDPHPDRPDWVEGSFRFRSDEQAVRSLLALAPDVEVLLPADLRSALAELAARVAEQHARPAGSSGSGRGAVPATGS
jgi:predicted DNA-binding transcriptional regulator YafY